MDTDINDIWDLPVETTTRHLPTDTPDGDGPGSTSLTRASNGPLFLPSDDDEDAPAAAAAAAPTSAGPKSNENPDVDALFEGLDDMDDSVQELAPALDLDALRREADARHTSAVRAEMAAIIPTAELSAAASKTNGRKGGGPLDGIDGEGEADDDGKKKRKPVPKLDEARLLGKNGFLQLVKDTKNFKPKGKGHETTDLDRVLQVYQFWTHKLYPKTRFKETVDRVEKLCHSKRMQVALSVWHDEAHGLVNGVRLPPPEDNNNDSDADSDAGDAQRGDEAEAAAATAAADQEDAPSSGPSSLARSRLRRGSGVSATSDSEGDSDGPAPASDASHPPPSSPERDEVVAAGDLDALLEEEEALRAKTPAVPTAHAWKASSGGGDAVAMDEDEDLWDMVDTGAPTSGAAIQTAPAPPAMDDDEDMWDIVNEIEQDKEKEATRPPNPMPEPPAAASAQVDDLDDLYL